MTQTIDAFPTLQGHQYMNLITFRKSGQAVSTPVWFAETDGKLYVTTIPDSGKVKRIRNNGRVQLAPANRSGKPLGPEFEAMARILSAEEEVIARNALNQKYGLLKSVFDFFMHVRGTQSTFIEISPVENDLI